MLPIQRADSIQEYASIEANVNILKQHVGLKTDTIHEIIISSLSEIGNLRLRRDNRVGFPSINNGAKDIQQIRKEKNDAIALVNTTGRTNQDVLAEATYDTLGKNPGAQAYCGEHAYYMRDALANRGIPLENMNVIFALAKVYDKKSQNGVRKIDHAFLLYSDKQFTQGQLLSEHIALNDKNRYIIIDAWASKKISEYKGVERPIRYADFIHEYIHEVMHEVDAKYKNARTISYAIDDPYSTKKPDEGNIKKFYKDRPYGDCDYQPTSKKRKLEMVCITPAKARVDA